MRAARIRSRSRHLQIIQNCIMRLTNILLYYIRRHHNPGRTDIGKNRIHKAVTCAAKTKAMSQMVIEQRNLDILEKPYLSEAEDNNFLSDAGLSQEYRARQEREQIESRWLKPRLLEESFTQLELSRKWE